VRAFALYLLNRQHLPVERTAELLGDVLGARSRPDGCATGLSPAAISATPTLRRA